jgi:hypothetical protein
MHRVLLISMLAIVPGLTVAATDATPVEAAWAALHKALDGNEDRKRQALAALGSVDPANELAVKLLVDALQDKDPLVRQTAATALGEMKAKQAIGSLHDAITDKGEVAFAAAKALADMGDSGGRDMFVAMIAGERSDAPGIVASGIRDARKRLKHPQGLLLAQKKLRGRCSRRRHTALPPPRRLSRRKDLPAAQSLPCTWRKTPIPTPSRYWNGPFRIPVGACARLPLRAWRRAATRRPSPNCNSSWMIRTPPYGPCPPRPYFISATKRSRLVRFVRAARRLAQVASPLCRAGSPEASGMLVGAWILREPRVSKIR